MSQEELIRNYLQQENVFAVVGASRDHDKYGHRVYQDLKEAGYQVFPVNPQADRILGDKCYSRLEDLPVKPDVVDIVVPPAITEKIVRQCQQLDIGRVWMQPGSESEAAITYCQQQGIKVLHDVCVMVQRQRLA